MHLISATIRDYRIHHELTVDFERRLTLIAAPNETGKSTLVEALHRVLFLRHRTGGAVLESMRSRHGGHPQVDLRFAADGHTWLLSKLFRGPTSTCRLQCDNPVTTWDGDAAEDRLAELMGCFAGRTEKELQQRWDHLWSRQGAADLDPLAGAGQADLSRALAGQGGGVVLGADEQRLIAALRKQVDTIFTERGGWRVDSAAGTLERDQGEAERRLQQLRQEVENHRSRINELGQKRSTVLRCAGELATRQPRLIAQKAEVEAVASLTTQWQEAVRQRDAADQAAAALEAASLQLEADRTRLATAQLEVAEMLARRNTAETALSAARFALEAADADGERASKEQSRAEANHAAAAARAQLQDLARQSSVLEQQRERRHSLLEEHRLAGVKLDAIPTITSQALTRLRALEMAAIQGRAALDAVGTVVRVTSGPWPVILNGESLAPGSERRLTVTCTLAVAETRLEIVPGGGADLTSRREACAKADTDLAQSLERVGARSYEEASARLEQRRVAEATVKSAADRLGEIKDPAEDLQKLLAEQYTLAARLEALNQEADPGDASVDDLHAVVLRSRAATVQAVRLITQLRQSTAKHEQTVQESIAAMTTADLTRAELAGRVLQAEKSLGDTVQLAARRAGLALQCTALRSSVEVLAAQLNGREADILRRKCELEQRSLEALQTEHARADAEARQLSRDLGSLDRDLDGELEEAEARRERLGRSLADARRDALGTRLLLTRLDEAATALRERQEAPFLLAAGRYLLSFFGADSRLGLSGGGGERRIDQVDRTASGFDTFPFASLSQGAREQVASAIRLAMAEIIAGSRADHSLPVVLDESFSSTDPYRLENLGTMLAEACDRGLQVILLTCDDRLTHLGEQRVIRLHRAARSSQSKALTSETDRFDEADGDVVAAGAAVAETNHSNGSLSADVDALFAAIPAGEGASTRTLRQSLCWEKDRFHQAQAHLISSGSH